MARRNKRQDPETKARLQAARDAREARKSKRPKRERRRRKRDEQRLTFFVDENLLGRALKHRLREADPESTFLDMEDPGTPARRSLDHEWIPIVAKQGWIVLTKDRRIRYRTLEREAFMSAGAAAFWLVGSDMGHEQQARALRAALPAMKRYARNLGRPLLGQVTAAGNVSLLEPIPERRAARGRERDDVDA